MSSNVWKLEPDPLKNNWLEMLNEWAQIFKGSVDWETTETTGEGNRKLHKATPTIRGIRMADCTGEGTNKKAAMNKAAELLSEKGRLSVLSSRSELPRAKAGDADDQHP